MKKIDSLCSVHTKAKGEENTFRFAGVYSKRWMENKVTAQDEKLRDYQGFHQASTFFLVVCFFSPDADTNTLAFVSIGTEFPSDTAVYQAVCRHWDQFKS